MRYHSREARILTWSYIKPKDSFRGQFDWGGRLLKVTEARKGSLRLVGNQPESVKAQGSLTVRETTRTGRKLGLSDPTVLRGKAVAQRIKVTLGITG